MLTPKQVEDARKQLGINTTNPSAPTASNLVQRLESKKSKDAGYLDRIKGDFQTRREEVKNINTGSASLPEKILQNAGQVAGGAADLVAELPGIKQGLDVVGKGVGQVAKIPGIKQGIELGIETYDKLPENIQKDLEAVVNIASLAPVGLGAKGGIRASEGVVGAVKSGAKVAKKGTKAVGKVAGEIIPTADRIVNDQVSKALDLTAGDIKNINLSTGNEVGEFLARKNLIRGNKAETTNALKDFFDTNYKTVRDEIGKVKTTYKQETVPRYKQALQEIQKQVGETTGLETATKEIKDLLKKKQVTLNDVQRAKELLDEHFSLYKVTGDVKEGVAKSGLTNLRKDLKQFIEKEVKNNTGADIGALNSDVSTAKSTLNAIEARSTRGLTRSNIKIGDLGVFGVGTMFGGPVAGLAAVAAKKILGTSAVRLKFAKWLDGISDAKKLRIREELLKGEVPEEVSKLLNQFSESKNQKTAKSALAKKPSISTNTTPRSNVIDNTLPPNQSLSSQAGFVRNPVAKKSLPTKEAEPLYHGTNDMSWVERGEAIKPSETSFLGNGGVFFDKSPKNAENWITASGGYSKAKAAGKTGGVVELRKVGGGDFSLKKLGEGEYEQMFLDTMKDLRANPAKYGTDKYGVNEPRGWKIVNEKLKKQGFDGIDFGKGDGTIFNPKDIAVSPVKVDPLITEARKYKTTVNLQDKNDIDYLKRIFSDDTISDIKSGKKTNWRGESYEDLARVNIVSETPKTIAQQLEGKISDIKLPSNTFYHGTSADNARGIMASGFKAGSSLPENSFRGGGYGKMQNSISFAETPKEASIFSQLTRDGEIVEATLKDNAKVVSIKGIEDATDLEDYIPFLKKQKVDAVYIGGGEKELVVINPKAVVPTKSQLTDIYNQAHGKIKK